MLQDVYILLKHEFGLKDNHILILDSLNKEEKTAEIISKETHIPMGRIYDFLGDLEKENLILKKNHYPAVYSFKEKGTHIRDFLSEKFKKFIETESKIVKELEKEQKAEETRIIQSSQDYALFMHTMLEKEDQLFIVTRNSSVHPDFYPYNKEEYHKVREGIEGLRKKKGKMPLTSGETSARLFRSFQEYVQKGKEIEYVVTKQGADTYFEMIHQIFGKSKVKNIIKEIMERIVRFPNSKMYIIDDYFPYDLHLSKGSVELVLTSGIGLITGFASNNDGVVEVYRNLFDSVKKKAAPLLPYLKQKLKEFHEL